MHSEDDKKTNSPEQKQPTHDSDVTQKNDAIDGLDLGFGTAEQVELNISSEAVLQSQLDNMKDETLRLQAEMQNIRRRAEKDVVNAHKFALDKFAGELLSVVDNLERALATISAEESETSLVEGLKLTYRGFLDILAKFKIEQINPKDEAFDPQYHEAVTMIDVPGVKTNIVVDVVQKGTALTAA